VGGWTLNVKTKKITWTPVTREIHQVPDDFEPNLDNGIQFYKSGYSRDRITQVVTEACRNGTPYDEELQLVTFTGKVTWVRAIGRAEFRDGQCVRLYGIFQDVHDKKRRERQQARISVMEARNRELEKFAYITSHDLRQPVRTVLSYCELLQEDFGTQLDPEALRYINVIGTAAEHMDALILGILDHSRLGRPKEMERVDGNRMLANVLSSLDSLVRKNGAQIDLASPLPNLWGYPVEMAMLWQNLLENAIKFSRPDVPPRIMIDFEKIEGGWQFTVSDNGIGISVRDHQEIFGFFRRLHSQDRYEGYGIGLAHCKKIVELHFGRIWVTSEPGQGSQFHFTILTGEPTVA
jgi:light-regulated signal transduction histidine kinase (bacteriophytochrome)